MALVRIPLALGESGTFPSALAATAEWFPRRERAFAIGLFNAGANVGAILTPLLVPVDHPGFRLARGLHRHRRADHRVAGGVAVAVPQPA